jgi:hypothetical protein
MRHHAFAAAALAALASPVIPFACVSNSGSPTAGIDGGGLDLDAGALDVSLVDTSTPALDSGVDATLPDANAADASPVDGSEAATTVDAPSDSGNVVDATDATTGVDATDAAGNSDASDDTGSSDASDGAATPDASDAAPLSYPAVVEADDPLSYWRFGESTGSVATDEMGSTSGTYNGTVTLGAPGAIVGDSNTAATFDGVSGYVDMGAGFAFGGTSAMSFEAWVSPGLGDNGARRFLSKETNNGGRQGYLMAYTATADAGSATLSWERWGAGGTDATATFIAVGVYSHVVVTYDGATMAIYVNGVQVGTAPSTRSIQTLTDSFRVATYSDFLSASDCFPGTIDEVAIYDHALSPTRIALHYQVGSGQ